MKIFRNRFVWVAVILLAVSAGAAVLANSGGSEAKPADVRGQILAKMRSTLEQVDPGQHNHAGHQATAAESSVVCGVHVYGYEPADATAVASVRTVYGFHLCGVAEARRPWDVAVKLAGPLIMDMSADPPGIQVVEATADTMYIDRLKEMFPPSYAELAQKEALPGPEMSELRRRYDDAAGL
ncbi:hypothetical protein SAMN05421812_104253 [Asanoa hainanensis]|uniref:Uncharacterized protein n=1 Tax=Asanoa hainanensis TaxID=560556 RepID=A0A239LDF7_9ACTN|nr:hypothetical protein [Asanoa hainanensis]SNT28676.1 hypothetical protein SAMN05421812_104253 [Asanoa hainanensis]